MNSRCTFCQIKSQAVKTLTPDELLFLEQNCAEVNYKPGEVIIRQGKPSSHIAYVKSGLVKIHMEGPRNDQVLKISPPGSYIGIQSILSSQPHQYSVTALAPCEICHIDIRSFNELIKRNTEFANELIIYLCTDELNYFKRFVSQSQKQINGKLADSLLYFADEIFKKDEYQLPISRTELGTFLCTTRESTSRAIKELSDLNAIEVNGKKFRIKNRELLSRISRSG